MRVDALSVGTFPTSHSSKLREYLSQHREPSDLQRDQMESLFDLDNPVKPVRHAEPKAGIKDVRIAEMAYYRFQMPQFGVGKCRR
jgi:hypothetical protein